MSQVRGAAVGSLANRADSKNNKSPFNVLRLQESQSSTFTSRAASKQNRDLNLVMQLKTANRKPDITIQTKNDQARSTSKMSKQHRRFKDTSPVRAKITELISAAAPNKPSSLLK